MKNSRVLIASKEIEDLFDERMFTNIPKRCLAKGEVCYPETPRILLLKEGELKISLYENSKELILYFLHKNNLCFCNNDIMITAKKESRFYIFESHNYSELFKNSDFCNLILNSINQNIFTEREILKSLSFESGRERTANFFRELALSIGKKNEKGIIIDIKCTMEETAGFLGLSRQRFSACINEMINLGIIDKINGKRYLIKSLEKLHDFCT